MATRFLSCAIVGGRGAGDEVFWHRLFELGYLQDAWASVDINDESVFLKVLRYRLDWDKVAIRLKYVDSVIIMFAVDQPASFEDVKDYCYPKVKEFRPGVQIVLVGTNIELRDDPEAERACQEKHERGLITKKEGGAMAKKIGACYVECSIEMRKGIDELFRCAVVPPERNKNPLTVGKKKTSSFSGFFGSKKAPEKTKVTVIKPGEPRPSLKLENNYHTVKIITVGDYVSNKTTLLFAYTTSDEYWPMKYIPTVFDHYYGQYVVNNELVDVALCDTRGQEDYDDLRILSYPATDVAILCFCCDNPITFGNIYVLWVPELRYYCPGIKFVLICSNAEVRDDPDAEERCQKKYGRLLITPSEGREMAERIGAYDYVECRMDTREGVNDAFAAALAAFLAGIRPKK